MRGVIRGTHQRDRRRCVGCRSRSAGRRGPAIPIPLVVEPERPRLAVAAWANGRCCGPYRVARLGGSSRFPTRSRRPLGRRRRPPVGATASWSFATRQNATCGRRGGAPGPICHRRRRSHGTSRWRCSRWRQDAGVWRNWNGSSVLSCGRPSSIASAVGAVRFRVAGHSSPCAARRTHPAWRIPLRWCRKATWSDRWHFAWMPAAVVGG
jgi:hypothetical protein